jgi:uncharacterized membrane protein YphA (DoxX/SURF4 family)
MNAALWAVQGLLAVAFLAAGEVKLFAHGPCVGAVGRFLIAALFLISGLGKIAAPALGGGILLIGGLLQIVALGAGTFSIDSRLAKSRTSNA